MTPRELQSATMAGIGAIIFVVVSTIYSEISAPFKALLTSAFGHHWIAKSILSILIFGILFYYFTHHSREKNHWSEWTMAKNITIVSVLAGLIIFGFFVKEFLG